MILPNSQLIELRRAFEAKGHNLWFVGGCVRDSILGEEPKDIDLCTDALPDEQLELYSANKITFIPTGLDHGTISIRLDGVTYEITSLRTEADHDGRRAICNYTKDLNEDLSRRDLTINAIAQDFDGNIIDPFNGVDDLDNLRVRFVGNPAERMNEDYLRILRFFRFHTRFAGICKLDAEAVAGVISAREGLKQISGERIWQEMKKLIVMQFGGITMLRMQRLKVLSAICCNDYNGRIHLRASVFGIDSAPSILGLSMSAKNISKLADRWVLATSERQEAHFINEHKHSTDIEYMKDLLVEGANPAWVNNLITFHRLLPLTHWAVPVFPITGHDMIRRGIKTGPAIGLALSRLRSRWKASRYTLTKKQLLG